MSEAIEKAIEKKDKSKKNLTVLGRETEFDGTIEFSDNLVITGKFSGKIEATGDLEIAAGAVCDVENMKAEAIEISGNVSGDMEASRMIELCAGSIVKGNITAPRIRIEDNVDYEGEVSMIEAEPDANMFSAVSQEYKNAFILKTNIPR